MTCQSIFHPESTARRMEPRALAFDDSHRHECAFCQNDQMFRDFLLSRIVEFDKQWTVTADPDGDVDWHEEITRENGPQPELSPAQLRAIEMDYGMVEKKAHIPVRRALQIYALHRIDLDTNPVAQRPRDQKIVPLNRDQSDRSDFTLPSREGTPSASACD